MALWMLYATLLAALFGAAAALGEWLLRTGDRPGRWSWATAMAASLALPAWALWAPPALPSPDPDAGGAAAPGLVPELGELLAAARTTPSALAGLDPWLQAGWVALSLLLAGWLVGGLLHLAAQARRWPRVRVSDQDVLVSGTFGPALLGLRRPRVILPRWSLRLDEPSLEMVLLHEREHARAGDGILLLGATLAVAAAPWNPALWWQLRRLRGAMEMDCDRRVLRRGVSPAGYGRLLLELGRRGGRGALAVAGLARPHSLLERRLTMMARGVDRGSPARRIAAVALGLALVIVACEAPPPTATEAADAGLEPVVPAPSAGGVRLVLPEAGEMPLFFVDGVRVDGKPHLAPEEIARVEVLKDEGSRSLYGEAAEHGVVRITTKEAAPAGALGRIQERALGADEEADRRRRQELVRRREIEKALAAEKAGASEATSSTLGAGTFRFQEGALDGADAPEVYLDDVPFEGDIRTLDKSAIDRIEVQKEPGGGPSAIRIYTKG